MSSYTPSSQLNYVNSHHQEPPSLGGSGWGEGAG